MERDVFLTRVGSAAMRAHIPVAPEISEQLPEHGSADLVSLFRERARDVDAVVHGPMSRHGVPRVVAGIAAGHQCQSFVVWEDLPVPGVASSLAASGLDHADQDPEAGIVDPAELGNVDLGVTSATAGLAESGSLVLEHSGGNLRLASLLPRVHVALLPTTKISYSLRDWMTRHPEIVARSANLVVVSGPSRTGDIEQALNLGVHGPAQVHVVLIR